MRLMIDYEFCVAVCFRALFCIGSARKAEELHNPTPFTFGRHSLIVCSTAEFSLQSAFPFNPGGTRNDEVETSLFVSNHSGAVLLRNGICPIRSRRTWWRSRCRRSSGLCCSQQSGRQPRVLQ